MLNKLAKNQYVKIIKSNLENSDIEYGVVLNDENEKYDIMSASEPICLHNWRTANLIMIVAKQRQVPKVRIMI